MRRRSPQHYCAFDMVWLNGRDLRTLPLLERKRIVRGTVPAPPSPILYVDHLAESGIALFEAACRDDLEGIVAKPAGAAYGEEGSWVKIKNRHYSQAEGRHDFFNARAA